MAARTRQQAYYDPCIHSDLWDRRSSCMAARSQSTPPTRCLGIVVDVAGDLQVRWNVTGVVRPCRPGDVSLDLPDFGSITVPAQLNRGRGAGMIMYATVGDRDAECGHTIATCHNLPMIFPAGSGLWQGIGASWDCLHRNTETRRHRLSSTTGHREHMARLLRLFRRRRLTRSLRPRLNQFHPRAFSCEVADQGD
jgi:hypothetical protein